MVDTGITDVRVSKTAIPKSDSMTTKMGAAVNQSASATRTAFR